MASKWTDTELVRACLKHDAQAQKYLWDKYAHTFLAIAYRYAGNYDVANDMLQEGFIRIFEKLKTFENKGSLEGWMKRVLVTTCLNYLRKHKKWKTEPMELVSGTAVQMDAEIMQKMDTDELLSAIEQLPENSRCVLNMHAIEGFSYKEMAAMLGSNEATLRVYYNRAKNQLFELIKKNKYDRENLA